MTARDLLIILISFAPCCKRIRERCMKDQTLSLRQMGPMILDEDWPGTLLGPPQIGGACSRSRIRRVLPRRA